MLQPQSLDLISKYFIPPDQPQMTDEPKRNSTRAKKVPTYLRMDDSEYGLYSGGRNLDTKENKNNPQELNQAAKLLIKFINLSNQRAKAFEKEDLLEPSNCDKNLPGANRNKTSIQGQKISKNSLGSTDALNTANKAQRERGNLSNGPNKAVSKNYAKKDQFAKNAMMGLSNTIESDMSYHAMLGQHIRATLPDSRNLSAETLMKLGLPPKEMLQQKKGKDSERKKSQVLAASKMGKGREQLKPFKRQSYHVAIAYHIYLKQIKSGPNPSQRDLDPTGNARKLREQSMKQ